MEDIRSLNKERIRYIKLAYSYVRDYSMAEDIFGESIFKLMDTVGELYISEASTFFLAMIKNSCLDYLGSSTYKAGQNRIFLDNAMLDEDIAVLSSDAAEEKPLYDMDFPQLLAKCKDKLPELSYEVFLAKRLDKMSYRQISKLFGIPEDKINYEMKKAQSVFRKEFKDYIPMLAIVLFFSIQASNANVEILRTSPDCISLIPGPNSYDSHLES